MNIYQKRLIDLARREDINRKTRKELAEEVGLKYPSHVYYHLQQLVDRGFLKFTHDRHFYINPAYEEGRAGFWQMPILGNATCGEALAFAENDVEDYVKVSTRYAGQDSGCFAVHADGDSMNRANINGLSIEDGDLVIIDPRKNLPSNGDYILSVMDGLANIKRFYRDEETGQVTLLSESTSQHAPIFIHPDDPLSYFVAGTVTYVLKQPNE